MQTGPIPALRGRIFNTGNGETNGKIRERELEAGYRGCYGMRHVEASILSIF